MMTKSLKNRTLLVVEDDASARSLIKYFLEKMEIKVLETDTAEAALELVKNEPVEGMLLDIALGAGLSGLELGKQVRSMSRHRQTPMMAVTSYSKRSLDGFDEAGFTGYLQKPYSSEDLKALLEQQQFIKTGRTLII